MMKTAVILSARKDKGTDIPYPLKPYCENICLMDRIIEALTALIIPTYILWLEIRRNCIINMLQNAFTLY